MKQKSMLKILTANCFLKLPLSSSVMVVFLKKYFSCENFGCPKQKIENRGFSLELVLFNISSLISKAGTI